VHGLDRIRLRQRLGYIATNVREGHHNDRARDGAGYSPYHFARMFTLAWVFTEA